MIEQEMEDLLAAYPEEFFQRQSFVLKGRQQSFAGVGRFDLLFGDQFQTNSLMELKARTARYEDATQLAKYKEELERLGEKNVLMWLVAPHIPKSVSEFFFDRLGALLGAEHAEPDGRPSCSFPAGRRSRRFMEGPPGDARRRAAIHAGGLPRRRRARAVGDATEDFGERHPLRELAADGAHERGRGHRGCATKTALHRAFPETAGRSPQRIGNRHFERRQSHQLAGVEARVRALSLRPGRPSRSAMGLVQSGAVAKGDQS